jgi:hypothetical protein
VLVEIGKRASLSVDKSTVTILTHVDADSVDKLGKGVGKVPAFGEAVKGTTLLKLLGGG